MKTESTTTLPNWPRAMTAELAAAYCSCKARELPPASYGRGRSKRWLIESLNKHLGKLAGKSIARDEEEMLRAMKG
ncbi:MAG: hypothetical protein U1E42_08440 [Rhodospirillales bacterium]